MFLAKIKQLKRKQGTSQTRRLGETIADTDCRLLVQHSFRDLYFATHNGTPTYISDGRVRCLPTCHHSAACLGLLVGLQRYVTVRFYIKSQKLQSAEHNVLVLDLC